MIKTHLPAVVVAAMIGSGAAVAAAPDTAPPASAPAIPAAPNPPPALTPDPAEKARKDAETDRAAFFDAHLAALRAGLTLSPEQDKLWPPFETAMRGFTKLRETMRPSRAEAIDRADPSEADDPIAMLERTSERLLQRGQAMKALADASDPLYASLSEDQKRRLPRLLRDVMPKAGPVARMMSMLGPDDDRQAQTSRDDERRSDWDRPRERGWGDHGWRSWRREEADRDRQDDQSYGGQDWKDDARRGMAESKPDDAYDHRPQRDEDEDD